MRHALRLMGLVLLCWFGCSGCRNTTTTTPPVQRPPVYDVSWFVLVRDYQTASSYAGVRVRIRLDPTEYQFEGDEIKVRANDNGSPPILTFRRLDRSLGKPYPSISVTGTCYGPVRDGHWRTRNADYCVFVDDCTITVR